MKSSSHDVLFRTLKYLTLVAFVFMIVTPLVFIVAVSFMPSDEFLGGAQILPKNPTLDSYRFALQELSDNLVNSFLAASGTAILSLIIAITGGYVFARKEFPGRKAGFYSIITAMMFPYVLLVVPITELFDKFGLYNTIPGLILSFQLFVTPFMVWILRDFFEKLPPNLEEAARVYGCSEFTAFVRVILPISLPAIVSAGFISFVIGWQEFLFSSMLTNSRGPRPATVQLFLETVANNVIFWGDMMAMTVIIAIPTVVLYFIARQSLSETFAM